MGTGELGTWYLGIWAVVGGIGTFAGGALTARFLMNDESRQLKCISASIAVFGALSLIIYTTDHRYVALAMMMLAAPFYTATFGPFIAIVQTLVVPSMRATAVALLLFFSNFIGMGFGGLATGMLSDALTPLYGNEALRYSLLAMTPGFFWVALHFWLASRTVTADIVRANDPSSFPEATSAGVSAPGSVPI